MARGLPALLLFVVALVLPAVAQAGSTKISVPLPAEGDVSLGTFRVTTASPGKATILRKRRLGDMKVIVEGRRLKRRRYEVTMIVLNPLGGGASAAQGGGSAVARLRAFEEVPASSSPTGGASNLFTQPLTPDESTSVDQTCTGAVRRLEQRTTRYFSARFLDRRNRVRSRFGRELCQTGTPATKQQLRALGVNVPACTGTAAPYPFDPNEAVVSLTCTEGTDLVTIQAQGGNIGANCLGPPGSLCQCGPACAPFPPESGCFFDRDGFDLATPLEFRTAWQQQPKIEEVRARSRPLGAQSPDLFSVYLRLLREAR